MVTWPAQLEGGGTTFQLLKFANGWTLGAEKYNPALRGMTQKGLAICLALLTKDSTDDGELWGLDSSYVTYLYCARMYQESFMTNLFLSVKDTARTIGAPVSLLTLSCAARMTMQRTA